MFWILLLETLLVTSLTVKNGFEFLYSNVKEKEFVLCLEGVKKGSELTLTDFRLAEMPKATTESVSYTPCKSRSYVGTAHNHLPHGGQDMCYQSAPDRKSFVEDSRALIDVVLCGPRKFRWWDKQGNTELVQW